MWYGTQLSTTLVRLIIINRLETYVRLHIFDISSYFTVMSYLLFIALFMTCFILCFHVTFIQYLHDSIVACLHVFMHMHTSFYTLIRLLSDDPEFSHPGIGDICSVDQVSDEIVHIVRSS